MNRILEDRVTLFLDFIEGFRERGFVESGVMHTGKRIIRTAMRIIGPTRAIFTSATSSLRFTSITAYGEQEA